MAGKVKLFPGGKKSQRRKMKSKISIEKAVPVPARVKVIAVLLCTFMFAAFAAVGAAYAPESDVPVALANGEVITPPWYITIDGKKTALVESRESAAAVMDSIIDKYRKNPDTILDIQVAEDTKLEKMNIKNGDKPPDILTEDEARKLLLSGNDGESYLTVVVTREENDIESVECEEEYKPEPDMYVGETMVEEAGKDGVKQVTKKVVSENGRTVEEEVLEEKTLKEPSNRIVLTGTKNYDGYGGGNGVSDEGVSFQEGATYNTLENPVGTMRITSKFGPRWGRIHYGLDLGEPIGEDIFAADSGTVYHAGYSGYYGNLVKIDHGNGMQTYYAHCSSLLVSEGQRVERGERIALIGSTGNSTGPHLHFEVIINGVRVDPLDFLDIE